MKKIGFLSFGHWTPSPQSQTRSGVRRAAPVDRPRGRGRGGRAPTAPTSGCTTSPASWPRRSRCSPRSARAPAGSRSAPASSTCATRTRSTWPRTPGAADLISGGRLQLGISRGSPEQVIDGFRYFGYEPAEGSDHADMAREHTRVFLEVIEGKGFAEPNPRPMFPNPPGLLRIEPHSPGLRDRIWWGAGTRATAEWTAEQGMNLMSSTLLTEDTGVPFHQLQAEQIQRFRDAWKAAGHEREPRVSVSRSIFPIVSDLDRAYFGHESAQPGPGRPHRRRHWPGSASRTPGSPTSWSRSSPRTRRSRPRTPCCSRSPTSSASTTTPTCSRASCATSRRSSAGAETGPVPRPPRPRRPDMDRRGRAICDSAARPRDGPIADSESGAAFVRGSSHHRTVVDKM